MALWLGVLGSWGVRCLDDVFLLGRLGEEDRLTTGVSGGCFLFLFLFATTFFSSWPSSRYSATSLCWASWSRCSPRYFVDSFFGFSGLEALLLLLLLGGLGSPCRVFPVFSPWFLGVGGVFLAVLLRLASLLHVLG